MTLKSKANPYNPRDKIATRTRQSEQPLPLTRNILWTIIIHHIVMIGRFIHLEAASVMLAISEPQCYE